MDAGGEVVGVEGPGSVDLEGGEVDGADGGLEKYVSKGGASGCDFETWVVGLVGFGCRTRVVSYLL